MSGRVEALHASDTHTFGKHPVDRVEVVAGIGITGDAHAGARVKHRSRVRADPQQPNLRQVHLLHAELFDELAAAGHRVPAGSLGENVTTRGIDLLALPTGAMLCVGDTALLALTGLRNPCGQIDDFQPGLLDQVRYRDDSGGVVRKAGVMAVVIQGGMIDVGAKITVALPPGTPIALRPV